ncbi:hypothetical protein IE53DRAFT_371388 [Violaceomyces palustris]|uniref:Uncharacterized protein n=1 Tax=Violaceomyces palustris TaxID=1673888 RepID=A0ACD0NNZ0_9BASI|nr:hypothetical protein IE53DRAFT_371388 [Violaceomyces palustris]
MKLLAKLRDKERRSGTKSDLQKIRAAESAVLPTSLCDYAGNQVQVISWTSEQSGESENHETFVQKAVPKLGAKPTDDGEIRSKISSGLRLKTRRLSHPDGKSPETAPQRKVDDCEAEGMEEMGQEYASTILQSRRRSGQARSYPLNCSVLGPDPSPSRNDSVHSLTSMLSMSNDTNDLESSSKFRRGSLSRMVRKASVPSLKLKKQAPSSNVEAEEDADNESLRQVGRKRSSSLSSFTAKTIPWSMKIKVSRKQGIRSPDDAVHLERRRSRSRNHAPSSWKVDALSPEHSDQQVQLKLSLRSSSEELEPGCDSLDQDSWRQKAKAKTGGVSRLRHGSKSSINTVLSRPTTSEGYSLLSKKSPQTARSSPTLSSDEELAPVCVTIPGVPPSSSPRVNVSSLVPLTIAPEVHQVGNAQPQPLAVSHLFQQLGPPPTGLAPTEFESRVKLVTDWINSRRFAKALSRDEEVKGWSRKSLPAQAKGSLTPATLVRSLSTATILDEFDKLECQFEQEMIRAIARGCDRQLVESLFLGSVFIESRRRCGLDHSKTQFQLFVEVSQSGGSPTIGAETLWADSPSGRTQSNGAASCLDSVPALLGPSLTPAPRKKKRPTTAPENKTLGPFSHLPPSPVPKSSKLGKPTGEKKAWNVNEEEGYESRTIPRASGPWTNQSPIIVFSPQAFNSRVASSSGATWQRRQSSGSSPPPPANSALIAAAAAAAGRAHPPVPFTRRGSSDRESTASQSRSNHGSSSFDRVQRFSHDTDEETIATSESTLEAGFVALGLDPSTKENKVSVT